jgi:hypothetical protein
MIRQQFTLYLENRPGKLASVTGKLAKAKVMIEGLSATSTADVGLVQLVTSDATATRAVLTRSHIPFTVQDVAVLSAHHQPEVLAKGLAKLADAGVNINYLYATMCNRTPECNCFVVISAPDLQKVEDAWSEFVCNK